MPEKILRLLDKEMKKVVVKKRNENGQNPIQIWKGIR